MTETLPRALDPFVRFAGVLRAHRFPVSPDQTIGFIEAVGALGPRSIGDVHAAGLALFSIPPERRAEFDALFRAIFLGHSLAAPASGEEEDETEAHEETGGAVEVEAEEGEEESGADASVTERLSHRDLRGGGEDEALARFARLAPARLPRRRSYRYQRAKKGDRPDMRRAIRTASRRDGEIMLLPRRRRKTRQRRVLLLIDVSASMKRDTDASLRFAHALVQAGERVEVFTLGTRLTRITPALGPADRARALARAGALIADIDGGTRIGDALQAFLAVPRYAGFARGSSAVVLSDGLERGDPAALIEAARRLSRSAWRLDWLTPLAADAEFAPRTEALAALLPHVDALGEGGRIEAVAAHVLNLARAA